MRITVLGAGGWGTTLSIVLHSNGHEVILWEFKEEYSKILDETRLNPVYLPGVAIPKEIEITHSLSRACTDRHMIVIAIPTQFIRSALKGIKDLDFKNTTFVSVAKGIEKGTLLTVSQIIREELPNIFDSQIGVISGPSHAEEVSRKIPTAVVAASKDLRTAQEIQGTFITSYFRIYYTDDIIGAELGGAIKNIIAIGAGIIDGAKLGDNTKAAIMTRGVAEISRFGAYFGAKPETFAGLSGMGDMIVTCMSTHSRNRYVGVEIGKGKKLKEVLATMEMVAEGVETCRSVYELSKKIGIETPICEAVYQILFEDKDPIKATFDLMTRDTKLETL
jgi:glycerol-3-phosphate dehydrogenase (NAD(P)+)